MKIKVYITLFSIMMIKLVILTACSSNPFTGGLQTEETPSHTQSSIQEQANTTNETSTNGSVQGDSTSVSLPTDTDTWELLAVMPETPISHFDYLLLTADDDRRIDGKLVEGMVITAYNGNETRIRIPAEIDGKLVTQVGISGGEVSTTVTHVFIPRSVTGILTTVFPSPNFMGFEIESGNPLYSSLDGVVFAERDGEKYVAFYPMGRPSGDYVIPDGVTMFTERPGARVGFRGRHNLTGVTIPDSVTQINVSSFEDCINLQSVTIGNGVKTIYGSAFYGCKNLINVTIGSGVTLIRLGAFMGCDNLKTVTIHARQNDVEIQDGAFPDGVEIVWVNG